MSYLLNEEEIGLIHEQLNFLVSGFKNGPILIKDFSVYSTKRRTAKLVFDPGLHSRW